MSELAKNSRIWELGTSKSLVWTLLFSLGFLAFEIVALPKARISLTIFVRHFDNGHYLRLSLVLLLSLVAICMFTGFVYAAFSSSPAYRVIYFLVFSVLVLTEYGYYKALAGFFSFQELEVALYATNWGIISNGILAYFNVLALVPVAVFACLLLITRKVSNNSWIPLIVVCSCLFCFFFATTYFTSNTFYVHSFNHGMRTLTSFPVIWYVGTFHDTPRNEHYYAVREKIDHKSSKLPQKNIVFIVDESVRSDHLSVNGYEVRTTPTLEMLNKKGLLRNWGTAVSGTTCSVTANALLLTGLWELPDPAFRIFKLPTIFQYAKALNYKNHYFDGQVMNLWNGKSSDAADFGDWTTAGELENGLSNKYEIDKEIARRIKRIVSGSKGNFIWVNKYGVHQSYIDSYPESRGSAAERYDHAVRINLEGFFSELIDIEKPPQDTIYVYTSDHGRNLDQSNGSATHCSDTKAEASVPIMLLSSPRLLPDAATNYRASHANLFATLLDLMEFPEDKRVYDYEISLLKAKSSDSRQRHYFAGDIHDKNKGKRLPFDADQP